MAGGFLAATDFADGYALVQRETGGEDPIHVLIDRAGRVVSEASDGFFKVTGPPHDGLLPTFVYGRGFGYTDATGRFAIEPRPEVVDARGFSAGRGAVRVEDLWGFVDRAGRARGRAGLLRGRRLFGRPRPRSSRGRLELRGDRWFAPLRHFRGGGRLF